MWVVRYTNRFLHREDAVHWWKVPEDELVKITVRRTVKPVKFLMWNLIRECSRKIHHLWEIDILTPHLKQCELWLSISIKKRPVEIIPVLKKVINQPYLYINSTTQRVMRVKPTMSQTSDLQVVIIIICSRKNLMQLIGTNMFGNNNLFSEHLVELKVKILPSYRLHFNI